VGISQDLQRWQSILLAAIVVVLAATALATYALIDQLRAANQSVSYDHAERVIDADGMEIAMFARSANARGYLLSGDALFLENRRAARSELSARIANLRKRNVDAAMLVEIEHLLARLDVASDRAVATYAASDAEARNIWEREARPVQDLLVKQIGALVSVERAAFAGARERATDAGLRSAMLLVALLAGVAVLLLLLFYGYVRVSRALLARRKAEQEQATFRLLDQVPVGIFVLSARGSPYYANQHAKKLLGRGIVPSPTDRLAETYEAFEAGTDRTYPTDRLPILRALAGEVSECSDIEIRRGDEAVPLHVVGAPVHDSHGELLYAVAGFQDVRELQRVAMRDALTGLANRAAITQIFARERAVSARAHRPFSLALIDLDRFKSINDTHGHASGDEVLKRTAATISASLRRSDAVGRWGGEELVVLLPNTDAAGAGLAIEKTLAAVRALRFLGKDGAGFSVTFSAGVVVTAASEALDEAVSRADALLYEAKAAGRDRVNVGRASEIEAMAAR
jgi:diguanylate cyclase (GGDEF)-like protein